MAKEALEREWVLGSGLHQASHVSQRRALVRGNGSQAEGREIGFGLGEFFSLGLRLLGGKFFISLHLALPWEVGFSSSTRFSPDLPIMGIISMRNVFTHFAVFLPHLHCCPPSAWSTYSPAGLGAVAHFPCCSFQFMWTFFPWASLGPLPFHKRSEFPLLSSQVL